MTGIRNRRRFPLGKLNPLFCMMGAMTLAIEMNDGIALAFETMRHRKTPLNVASDRNLSLCKPPPCSPHKAGKVGSLPQ